jgi:sarcosine oxidase
MSNYDLIVIGGGGFGSGTAWRAAQRGLKVLVLEQFERGHDRGSSHGESRIIRKAYFEHPDYVPLLHTSYDLWRELESVSSRKLMTICGLMLSGQPDGNAVAGAKTAAEQHNLPIESLSREEALQRFPGFLIPEQHRVVYEADGGVLAVEDCVDALQTAAQQAGAEFHWDEAVRSWESDGRTARVTCDEAHYEAKSLVVSAGAWSSELLSRIAGFPKLDVLRKLMFWFPVRSDCYHVDNGGHGFYFEMSSADFYGFPCQDGQTIKVCQHSGGELIDDPSKLDHTIGPEELAPVAAFLRGQMPEVEPEPVRYEACMYTASPDHHFVVDRDPQLPNVLFAAGFSGHGFKFVPVIGQALADLVVEGETGLPIGFLGLGRFGAES